MISYEENINDSLNRFINNILEFLNIDFSFISNFFRLENLILVIGIIILSVYISKMISKDKDNMDFGNL